MRGSEGGPRRTPSTAICLLPLLALLACSSGWEGAGADPVGGPGEDGGGADPGGTDGSTDGGTDGGEDSSASDTGPSDTGPAPVDSDMAHDPDAAYPAEDPTLLKGIQPDFWPNPEEIAGNMAGSVAMNLVWAHWQPARSDAPCADGQVAYDGQCFTPQASVDAAIADWTDRGLAITAVVYGVPEWARTGRDCSPVSPGFEIFCAPDDPADYARFAGMIARRYNGANGVGRVADFVVHNEVNSNNWYDIGCGQGTPCDAERWVETYAGDYVAAFDAIRTEQAHARVYLSLDHHFGSPDYDLPDREEPLLAGQTVIRAVADAAGDRDWRVAYHPYPPDLLAPEFSPDDWPKVTYGNLGTLVGWLHATFPGSPAAEDVHLTESGVNSLSPSSESAQADGLCDSFRSVLGTPGIDRYIYHRMQDHPDETAAGLGVGLWSSDGVAKAAWSTWALANRFDLDPPQLSCGFEDLPHVTLTRSYDASRGHWASTRPAPNGFTAEDSWRLWRDEVPDSTLLFACAVGEHNLLTPDPACEGQHPLGPVGWIHDTAEADTVPLYRCYVDGSGDHFVSEDPGCEGQTTERLLGFAVE